MSTDPTTGTSHLTYEPFHADFTGPITVYHTKEHKRYVFGKPHPRLEKDRAYMMEINSRTNSIRIIPIRPSIAPEKVPS